MPIVAHTTTLLGVRVGEWRWIEDVTDDRITNRGESSKSRCSFCLLFGWLVGWSMRRLMLMNALTTEILLSTFNYYFRIPLSSADGISLSDHRRRTNASVSWEISFCFNHIELLSGKLNVSLIVYASAQALLLKWERKLFIWSETYPNVKLNTKIL